MSEQDIIERIQQAQEEESTHVNSIADLAGYVGMFIFYIGLFQMLSEDPDIKLNGLVVFIISVLIIAFSTFGPDVFAAYHVVGKKYLINYVFYGSRMVVRHMEITDDPLVIARISKEDEILITVDEEEEYKDLMRGMGLEYLTDDDVDKKIADAVKRRYDREMERKTNEQRGITRVWTRIREIKIRNRGDDND